MTEHRDTPTLPPPADLPSDLQDLADEKSRLGLALLAEAAELREAATAIATRAWGRAGQ